MKLLAAFCLLALTVSAQPRTPYGNNPAAGHYVVVNGVRLYYETYGQGPPLLLLHGNNGNLSNFRPQIDHFRKAYRVIAVDSREQGRSGSSAEPITYERMAADFNALLNHLRLDSVYVLGWSDGAINALLLGIHYPKKVRKIVAMAANLTPDSTAVFPGVWAYAQEGIDWIPADQRDTPAGRRQVKVTRMMFTNPNIPFSDVARISAPTLVMAGDHDMIRDEHTVRIFQHLPNGRLAILPGATHLVPWEQPELFNSLVETFFRTPFRRLDRIEDVDRVLPQLSEH